MASTSTDADVIIVGGGPVGMTMAAELDYRGIKTILFEKHHELSILTKPLVVINSRSMEHYRRLGLQDRIQAASYPRDLPVTTSVVTQFTCGHVLYHKNFGSWGDALDEIPGTTYLYHQPGVSANVPMFSAQNSLETCLKEYLEGCSNIKMFWGCEVVNLQEDEEGVVVTALCHPEPPQPDQISQSTSPAAPEEKVFRAKYVVGCDGGSSPVRKHLGVHMYGKFVAARAVRIAFQSPELFARMKELRRVGLCFVMNETMAGLLFKLVGEGGYALNIFLPSNTSDEEVQRKVDDAAGCLAHAIGENLPFTVTAVESFNMHGLVSTKFRVGRCILAGDSAHQWLPSGGLGLNAGISDVANLAWKLEAVLKGYGGEGLLDSYERERKPIADQSRCFSLALSSVGSATVAKIRPILTSNRITRPILGKVMGRSFDFQFTFGIHLILGFQYFSSPIVEHEYDASGAIKQNESSTRAFVPSSLPGCRAPHVVLPNSPTILDLFGKGFAILIVGGEESDLEPMKEELKRRGVPFNVHCFSKLPEITAHYDCKYFLIRPDGVVAWRANYQPSIVRSAAIVDTVLGCSAPKRIYTHAFTPSIIKKMFNQQTNRSGIFDTAVSAASVYLLVKHTKLSLASSLGIGMGLFWILRNLRTTSKSQFLQQYSRHKAVVCDKFGPADEVLRIEPCLVGDFNPRDILVRVHAASINPLDLRLRQGYGAALFKTLSKLNRKHFFPLILGRDCSGEVVAIGDEVKDFTPGDQVYGVPSFGRQGTHAEYVTLREGELAIKPNVSHKEAASLPWVACTAWTALVKHAGLNPQNAKDKKILVHAGTGGVGSFAIQLLKAWGAHVTTTCSPENIPLAHRLGADKAIDYTSGDFSVILRDYDVVLDTIGRTYERPSLSVLKWYSGATYVSLISPSFLFTLKFGSFFGQIVFSCYYRLKVILNRVLYGRAFYYSVAQPSTEALDAVREMVERGEIRPLIDAVYPMDEIIAAHKHVEAGHTRGKVIISMI